MRWMQKSSNRQPEPWILSLGQALRGLSVVEIAAVIKGYRQAARLAIEAGFDGVELHAASG